MGLPTSLPGPAATAPDTNATILSAASLIGFATRNVQPPSIVYVTINDFVHVTLYTSQPNVTVLLSYRVLRADGTVDYAQQQMMTTGDRLRNDYWFNVAEGFILSVNVSTPNTGILRGMMWSAIAISRGEQATAIDTQPLISDYVVSGQSLGWPGGRQISSVEGPGLITMAQIPNPGPGVNLIVTPPANTRWRLVGVHFEYITAAGGVNRLIRARLGYAGGLGPETYANTSQAAATTITYNAASWGYSPTDVPGSLIFMSIPAGAYLSNNVQLDFIPNTIVIGDQFGTIFCAVEEWLEPQS